jgi:hypothetical protein
MLKSWPSLLAIISLVTPALAADNELTSGERQALISQIQRCVPPLNIATHAVTTIDLRLDADGSVTEESKIVSSPTPEIGKAMLRAVSQCQPYRLPAQKYQKWKQILVDFDLGPPRQN